ncbi:MAG TPA: OsmC family protein [Acetobacteraceae bacterium]|nr:OsmC family protein [Acetobacteraceae bacterium]
MDSAALRALQAPLKQRYREDPGAARVTSRAEARLRGDLSCAIAGRQGETLAGLHPAAGGTGEQACSADMLLEALVACAGVTVQAVATAMGVALRGGRIVAEGQWDVRGTLGVDRAVPVGITDIVLRFELDVDADEARLARLIETTERYCVIFQTLRTPPRITVATGPG